MLTADLPELPELPEGDELAAEHDSIHTMLDKVDAFRAAALAEPHNWNETEAARMAVQYHWSLVRSIDRHDETRERRRRQLEGLYR